MDEFDDVGSSVPGQVMDDTVPHPLSSASIVTDQDQSGHGPTEPIWGSFPPITFAQLLAKEKAKLAKTSGGSGSGPGQASTSSGGGGSKGRMVMAVKIVAPSDDDEGNEVDDDDAPLSSKLHHVPKSSGDHHDIGETKTKPKPAPRSKKAKSEETKEGRKDGSKGGHERYGGDDEEGRAGGQLAALPVARPLTHLRGNVLTYRVVPLPLTYPSPPAQFRPGEGKDGKEDDISVANQRWVGWATGLWTLMRGDVKNKRRRYLAANVGRRKKARLLPLIEAEQPLDATTWGTSGWTHELSVGLDDSSGGRGFESGSLPPLHEHKQETILVDERSTPGWWLGPRIGAGVEGITCLSDDILPLDKDPVFTAQVLAPHPDMARYDVSNPAPTIQPIKVEANIPSSSSTSTSSSSSLSSSSIPSSSSTLPAGVLASSPGFTAHKDAVQQILTECEQDLVMVWDFFCRFGANALAIAPWFGMRPGAPSHPHSAITPTIIAWAVASPHRNHITDILFTTALKCVHRPPGKRTMVRQRNKKRGKDENSEDEEEEEEPGSSALADGTVGGIGGSGGGDWTEVTVMTWPVILRKRLADLWRRLHRLGFDISRCDPLNVDQRTIVNLYTANAYLGKLGDFVDIIALLHLTADISPLAPVRKFKLLASLVRDAVVSRYLRYVIEDHLDHVEDARRIATKQRLENAMALKAMERNMPTVSAVMADVLTLVEEWAQTEDALPVDGRPKTPTIVAHLPEDSPTSVGRAREVAAIGRKTLENARDAEATALIERERSVGETARNKPVNGQCLGMDRWGNRFWVLGGGDGDIWVERNVDGPLGEIFENEAVKTATGANSPNSRITGGSPSPQPSNQADPETDPRLNLTLQTGTPSAASVLHDWRSDRRVWWRFMDTKGIYKYAAQLDSNGIREGRLRNNIETVMKELNEGIRLSVVEDRRVAVPEVRHPGSTVYNTQGVDPTVWQLLLESNAQDPAIKRESTLSSLQGATSSSSSSSSSSSLSSTSTSTSTTLPLRQDGQPVDATSQEPSTSSSSTVSSSSSSSSSSMTDEPQDTMSSIKDMNGNGNEAETKPSSHIGLQQTHLFATEGIAAGSDNVDAVMGERHARVCMESVWWPQVYNAFTLFDATRAQCRASQLLGEEAAFLRCGVCLEVFSPREHQFHCGECHKTLNSGLNILRRHESECQGGDIDKDTTSDIEGDVAAIDRMSKWKPLMDSDEEEDDVEEDEDKDENDEESKGTESGVTADQGKGDTEKVTNKQKPISSDEDKVTQGMMKSEKKGEEKKPNPTTMGDTEENGTQVGETTETKTSSDAVVEGPSVKLEAKAGEDVRDEEGPKDEGVVVLSASGEDGMVDQDHEGIKEEENEKGEEQDEEDDEEDDDDDVEETEAAYQERREREERQSLDLHTDMWKRTLSARHISLLISPSALSPSSHESEVATPRAETRCLQTTSPQVKALKAMLFDIETAILVEAVNNRSESHRAQWIHKVKRASTVAQIGRRVLYLKRNLKSDWLMPTFDAEHWERRVMRATNAASMALEVMRLDKAIIYSPEVHKTVTQAQANAAEKEALEAVEEEEPAEVERERSSRRKARDARNDRLRARQREIEMEIEYERRIAKEKQREAMLSRERERRALGYRYPGEEETSTPKGKKSTTSSTKTSSKGTPSGSTSGNTRGGKRGRVLAEESEDEANEEVDDSDLCVACKSVSLDPGNVELLCDGCDAVCHLYCAVPPLQSVPKGNWYCENCRKKGIGRSSASSSSTSSSLSKRGKGKGKSPVPSTPPPTRGRKASRRRVLEDDDEIEEEDAATSDDSSDDGVSSTSTSGSSSSSSSESDEDDEDELSSSSDESSSKLGTSSDTDDSANEDKDEDDRSSKVQPRSSSRASKSSLGDRNTSSQPPSTRVQLIPRKRK